MAFDSPESKKNPPLAKAKGGGKGIKTSCKTAYGSADQSKASAPP
jgi:hypothetical protein